MKQERKYYESSFQEYQNFSDLNSWLCSMTSSSVLVLWLLEKIEGLFHVALWFTGSDATFPFHDEVAEETGDRFEKLPDPPPILTLSWYECHWLDFKVWLRLLKMEGLLWFTDRDATLLFDDDVAEETGDEFEEVWNSPPRSTLFWNHRLDSVVPNSSVPGVWYVSVATFAPFNEDVFDLESIGQFFVWRKRFGDALQTFIFDGNDLLVG